MLTLMFIIRRNTQYFDWNCDDNISNVIDYLPYIKHKVVL